MNREEILAKAKSENRDEMEMLIRDRSMRWTYLAMVLTAAVFAFVRAQQGQPMMDLCATVCISVAAGQIYQFIKTKGKSCLLMGLIAVIVAVFAIIRFSMGH